VAREPGRLLEPHYSFVYQSPLQTPPQEVQDIIDTGKFTYILQTEQSKIFPPREVPEGFVEKFNEACGGTNVEEFAWPRVDVAAERRSMLYHASLFHPGDYPRDVVSIETAVESIQSAYPHASVPDCLAGCQSRTESQLNAIRDIIRDTIRLRVNLKSGPGFPYSLWHASNQGFLDDSFDFIVEAALARLTALGSKDCTEYTPEQLFREGLVDVVKIFVKKEPHKIKKIKSWALRLISNVTLIDQIVDRVLYCWQNELEIVNWKTIPSKPGLGLDDAGIKAIYQMVQAAGLEHELCSIDVSGFDWSQRGYLFQFDAKLRCRLYDLGPKDWLATAILNRHHCVANSVFVDSGGAVYAQAEPGIMLSGWYNTSSTNSHIAIFMAWASRSSWAMAMGDDVLSRWTPYLEKVYRLHGMKLKQCIPMTAECFEFCSTQFVSGVGIPLNVGKMVVKALSAAAENEQTSIEALEYELRSHPRKDEILSAVRFARSQ